MAGATIAVASDHAGFDLKEILKSDLQQAGYAVLDLGTDSTASVDYPDFGQAMGDAIATGKAEKGVLVCGSGIGISIAAKVALRNCSRPNERCFSVREPTGVPADSAPHFDDPWSGPTYERWLRGAHVATPIVIHGTTTVDIGKDYFQDDPTPGPGDISDLDAQAASVFASAVDVTRKLHVEDTVDFGPEEVSFYFPDVWGWSHSHQDESDKVCIMAPGRTKESTTPTDVPTEWYEGSSAAHEYGHLVHYWQWDGNGKWVSYAFDVNGDGDISDEEAEQSSETPEHTIAALKEGWAELVEHWTFEGTESPSRCSAVENDGAMQCHGPVSCRINRQFTVDVKHALCDLVAAEGFGWVLYPEDLADPDPPACVAGWKASPVGDLVLVIRPPAS